MEMFETVSKIIPYSLCGALYLLSILCVKFTILDTKIVYPYTKSVTFEFLL